MPVKLSQLASKVASITLWFDQDDLNIEYYPNLLTDELLMGWQEAKSQGDAVTAEYIQSNNEAFLSLIHSWDLLEDDGTTTIPLNAERMKSVPIVIKAQIMGALMEEMGSPEARKPRTKRR